jgi:4'-phosphopantetheinyl transferase EntD
VLTVAMLRQIVEPPVAVAVESDPARRSPSDQTALGRIAARAALASLHVRAGDLRPGPAGPAWPHGIVGSIAHTDGVAVAIAAHMNDRAALGIDLERSDRSISARVLRRISTEAEREWLRTMSEDAALGLFCAKEATYKALSRFEPHPVSFADVSFEPRAPGLLAGALVSSVAPSAHITEVAARTLIDGGFVVAVVEVEASPRFPSRGDTEPTAQRRARRH